jgi:hypothetical protein
MDRKRQPAADARPEGVLAGGQILEDDEQALHHRFATGVARSRRRTCRRLQYLVDIKGRREGFRTRRGQTGRNGRTRRVGLRIGVGLSLQ